MAWLKPLISAFIELRSWFSSTETLTLLPLLKELLTCIAAPSSLFSCNFGEFEQRGLLTLRLLLTVKLLEWQVALLLSFICTFLLGLVSLKGDWAWTSNTCLVTVLTGGVGGMISLSVSSGPLVFFLLWQFDIFNSIPCESGCCLLLGFFGSGSADALSLSVSLLECSARNAGSLGSSLRVVPSCCPCDGTSKSCSTEMLWLVPKLWVPSEQVFNDAPFWLPESKPVTPRVSLSSRTPISSISASFIPPLCSSMPSWSGVSTRLVLFWLTILAGVSQLLFPNKQGVKSSASSEHCVGVPLEVQPSWLKGLHVFERFSASWLEYLSFSIVSFSVSPVSLPLKEVIPLVHCGVIKVFLWTLVSPSYEVRSCPVISRSWSTKSSSCSWDLCPVALKLAFRVGSKGGDSGKWLVFSSLIKLCPLVLSLSFWLRKDSFGDGVKPWVDSSWSTAFLTSGTEECCLSSWDLPSAVFKSDE